MTMWRQQLRFISKLHSQKWLECTVVYLSVWQLDWQFELFFNTVDKVTPLYLNVAIC